MKVMTLNCGSSSVKYTLFVMPEKKRLCQGTVERVGLQGSFIEHQMEGGETYRRECDCPDYGAAIKQAIELIVDKNKGALRSIDEIGAVGHRVVHGGEEFSQPALIDEHVISKVEEYSNLAPLHNPVNLAGIRAITKLLPKVKQVAVFDTAFLRTIPKPNYIYAVPYEWYEKYRVRRYGFHGTSHRYVSIRAAAYLGRNIEELKLVTLHIGNGVSITAVKNGIAFDHSLGFTTTEGAIMGTRCGDLDPGIVTYMMARENLAPRQMEDILNRKSGLLGITGKYSDRRDIENAMKAGDERCRLAFEMECYRLRKYIGAYIAGMGGADAIVFTAGVGENSPLHREEVCRGLDFLGVKLDNEKNRRVIRMKTEETISTPDSVVKVLVIPTDEELMIAEDTYKLIAS